MKPAFRVSNLLLSCIVGTLVGCGSASNDQGTSFALIGFTNVTEGTSGSFTCGTDDFDNLVIVPIGESSESTSGVVTRRCVKVQNNMTSQAMRAEQIAISYYIPGADEQPPSTTVPVLITLGASSSSSSSTSSSGSSTSSSTGLASLSNVAAAQFDMVPPEVRSWITLNRGSLPEAPFSMDIVVKVYGVSSAGDQLVTNEGYYQGQVTNDLVINSGTDSSDSSTTAADTGLTDGSTAADTAADTGITDGSTGTDAATTDGTGV